MNIVLDDADAIVEPTLHDSQLISINVIEAKNLSLNFLLVNKKIITLTLRNVILLNVIDFSIGNIVLDVTVSKIENKSDEYISTGIKRAINHPNYLISDEYISNLKNKGGNLLFCLSPSYGAEIYCVCEGIEIS
mgnify:CR=1 FL=1